MAQLRISEASERKLEVQEKPSDIIPNINSIFKISILDDNTYQSVKQLESKFLRPVVIIGPMAEPICDKLVIDWSWIFARCFEGKTT